MDRRLNVRTARFFSRNVSFPMSLIHFLLNLEQGYQLQGGNNNNKPLIYASNRYVST